MVCPVEVHDSRINFVIAGLPFEKEAIQSSRGKEIFSVSMKVCQPEDLIDKMNRFNEWEKQFNKNLSPSERLHQFKELFDLYLPRAVVQKAHDDHLVHLIEMQRKLKKKRIGLKDKGKGKKYI